MTCIIGYLDKKDNSVWIGGDSLGSGGCHKAVYKTPKVFRNSTCENLIMGATTSFRHIDLLSYDNTLFDEIDMYKNTIVDHKYMVTKFIPKIITLFKNGIVDQNDTNRGGNFIVGIKDKLFEIQDDYSVLEPANGICAVGSGEDIAKGSLLTTYDMDMPITEKIRMALQAAEDGCPYVAKPFKIINTKSKEEIIIT